MYLSVNNVKALNDYMLELTFENSEVKIFDVKPYLDTGVFTALWDESFFKRVKVSFDTIEWPNGIDLDPEVLYENGVNRYGGDGDYTAEKKNRPATTSAEPEKLIALAEANE
jgi:hypothetical protein